MVVFFWYLTGIPSMRSLGFQDHAFASWLKFLGKGSVEELKNSWLFGSLGLGVETLTHLGESLSFRQQSLARVAQA